MLLAVVFVEAAIALYVLYMADRRPLFVNWGLGTLNGRYLSPAADALRIAYHAVSEAATRCLQIVAPQSVPEHDWHIESIQDGGGHFPWHLAFDPSLLPPHDVVPLLASQVDPARFVPTTYPVLLSAAFIVCGLLGLALRKKSSRSKQNTDTPLLPLTVTDNTIYNFSTILDFGFEAKDTDLYTPGRMSPHLYYPPGFAVTSVVEAGDVAFRVDSSDTSPISDLENVLSGLGFLYSRDESGREEENARIAVDLENKFGYTHIMSTASAGLSETTAVSRYVSDASCVEANCSSLGEDDRTTCTRGGTKDEKSIIVPKTHKREKKSRMKTKLKKESALSCVTSPTSKGFENEENKSSVGVTNLNTSTTITHNEIISIPTRSLTPTSTSFEDSGETSVYKTALEEAFSPAKKFLRDLDTRMDRTRSDRKVTPKARSNEPSAYKVRSRKLERVPDTQSEPTSFPIIAPSFPKVSSIARSEVHTLTYGKSTHTAETPLHTLQEVALAVRRPQDREVEKKDDHHVNRPRNPASGSGVASERAREIKGSGARSLEPRGGLGRTAGLTGNSGKDARPDAGGCGLVDKDAVLLSAPVARALALEVTPSLCAGKETNPSVNLKVPVAISPSTLPVLTGARANRYRPAKRLRAMPALDNMETQAKPAKEMALGDAYTSIIVSMGSTTYLKDHLTKPRSLLRDAPPARPPLQDADSQWNWDTIWALRDTAVSSGFSDARATVQGDADEPESRVVDAAPPVDYALDPAVADLVISSVAAVPPVGPVGAEANDRADSSEASALFRYELQATPVGASVQIEEVDGSHKADDLHHSSVREGPKVDGPTPALNCGKEDGAGDLRQLSFEVPNPDHGYVAPNSEPGSSVATAARASPATKKLKGSPSLGRHMTHATDIKDLRLSLPPRSSRRSAIRRVRLRTDVKKTGPAVTVDNKLEEEYDSDMEDRVCASLPLSSFFGFEESGYTLPEDDRELFASFNDWQDRVHNKAAESAPDLQLGPVVVEVSRTGLADISDSGKCSSLEQDLLLVTVSAADIEDEVLPLPLCEGDGVQEHAPEKVSEICTVSVGDVGSGDHAEKDPDSDDEYGASLPLSSFFRFEESGIALPDDDRELFEPDDNWLAPVSPGTKSQPSAEHSGDKAELRAVDTIPMQDETSGYISEEIQVESQDRQGQDYEEAANWSKATGDSKAISGDVSCSGFLDGADSALVAQNIEEVQVSDSDIGVALASNFWPTEALIDTTLGGLYEVSGTFGESYNGLIAVEDALDEIQDVLNSLMTIDSGALKASVNASTSTSDLVQVCGYQQEPNGESQEHVRLLVDVGTSVSDTKLKSLTWDSATAYVSASTSTSVPGQDEPEDTPVYLDASTSTPAVAERVLSDMSTSTSGVALNEMGVNTDTEPADATKACLNAATSTSGLAIRDEPLCEASYDTGVRLELSDLEPGEDLEGSESIARRDLGASTLPRTPSVAVVSEEHLLASGSTVGDSPLLVADSRDFSPYRREYDFSNALCTPTLVVDDSPCFDYLAKEKWVACDAVSSTPTPAALPTTAVSCNAAGSRVSDLIARFQRPIQISTPAPRRAEAPVSPYLPRTPSPLSSAPLCPMDFLQAQDNEAASPVSPRALSPLLMPRCIVKVNGELRRTNLRAGLTDEIGERRAEGGSAKDKFSKEMLALLKRHNEKTIVNSS